MMIINCSVLLKIIPKYFKYFVIVWIPYAGYMFISIDTASDVNIHAYAGTLPSFFNLRIKPCKSFM